MSENAKKKMLKNAKNANVCVCGSGGHVGRQQHLGGFDVAAVGPVGPGQGGAEPGGLREERPALLPLPAPHREGRGAAGVVRQRPDRPAAAQLQQSAGQDQRYEQLRHTHPR